ncbi:MAG: HlyD family type I secretion periplasmic adaptor subunit [Siculibacillus sp.]|nr:HlyD family type I secretion periplasmic adaptor subunit [Siculibacillus sp.]
MSEPAAAPDRIDRPAPFVDEEGMDRHLRAALLGAVLLVFGVGGFAVTVPLAGAVIAGATVVAESNDKKVQHQQGGIVTELLVRNGAAVTAGDLLLRLDPTQANSSLQIVSKALDQGLVREARLKAERDGEATITLPEAMEKRRAEPEVAAVIAEELRLFENRRAARDGLRSQLRERITQLHEEIRGLEAQKTANERQTGFIAEELTGVRDLYRRNLVQISRLSALERESARLAGEEGQLIAAIARTRGRITETELQIIQIDQDLRTEVGRDIREIQSKNTEFIERRIALDDQLARVEIRSPQTGTVHQLNVHAAGAVIAPGETIMVIVPREDVLVLEARIAPHDIDHVARGQHAVARLSAFDQTKTPEIGGIVTFIAPDLVREPQTNLGYYVARITLDARQLETRSEVRLLPGMPAEVHLQTGERTAMSYLLKPLFDQVARAFKER